MLHALMDANREAPRSYTGGGILLGGAVIDTISTRQHHASPDVNASEIHAACTVVAKVLVRSDRRLMVHQSFRRG